MKNCCFLLFIFLLQYQPNHKKENVFFQSLQGDWVNDKFTFCFWDSLGDYNNAFRDFQKFNLKNDTLWVDVEKTPENLLFKIQKINQDSLILLPLDVFSKGEINADTSVKFIALRKLKNQWANNEEIAKMSYSTNGCYGVCPKFDLEINANGKTYFQANGYNEQSEGNYEAILDSTLIQLIFNKIKQVKQSNLHNKYPLMRLHIQPTNIIIILKNKQKIKSEIIMDEFESKELFVFFKYLFALEKVIKWKKTDTIHFYETAFLPPPIISEETAK